MTDTTVNQTAPKEVKIKTVMSDLAPRSPHFFASVDEAVTFLSKAQEEIPEFAEGRFPTIMTGVGEDGFDPAVYTDQTRVMVHVLTNRGPKMADGTAGPSTVRCIVVHPVPTAEAVTADTLGIKWLNKILDTQIARVAVASLRTADDFRLAAKEMPGVVDINGSLEFNLSSYFSGRESSSIFETYDTLYKLIIDFFASRAPAWKRARLNKAELRRAMESRAYALAVYPALEDRGEKSSLFEMAIQAGIKSAQNAGLDSTVFDTWLAERYGKVLSVETGAEDDLELSEDDLILELETATEVPAEEAAPTVTE